MIRVLLVEDHESLRQALAFVMERESDLRVVAQAGTLAEARQHLAGIDVAIVDLELPDGSGVELIQELRQACPDAAVLVLTGSTSRSVYAQAVAAGASGVLHKSAGLVETIQAVRRLSEGELLFTSRQVMELFQLASQQRQQDQQDQAAAAAVDRLTPREREILQALAEGLNDKGIAQRLHISAETARTHMVNILRKLEVESRIQALIMALRYGIVKLN